MFVVCTFVLHSSAWAQVVDAPYFPAQEGTKWTYRTADGVVTVRVAKFEKQNGIWCARMETLDRNEVVAVQHVAITPKGVVRVAHNGEKVDPPMMLLEFPIAGPRTWTIDSKMSNRSGTEMLRGKCGSKTVDVTVPGMSTMNVKLVQVTFDFDVNGKPASINSWYAEKVGLVRQRIFDGDKVIELNLEKIEFPK
jgi:hypothetical protein